MGSGIGAVVASVVIGLALVLLARRLRGRGERTPDPRALATEVPRLNVVTLGTQGAGKTILLASMYRCMQTPAERGFYLKAPHAQVIDLTSWFQDVADPSDVWPAGTSKSEMREFEFDLLTATGQGQEPVLRIGYLEYAGELLTEPQPAGSAMQAQLLSAVGQADALIGIVDGLRVLQAFRGHHRGAAILQRTVDTMVSTMFTAHSPIAFVITKWDLLDELHPDANVRLGIVRNLLLGIAGFRDLVREHSRRRVIRLIPVTAVGHDFAKLDDGTVHKKAGGRIEPENVDIPLSTVVPDVLMQTELALDAATRQALVAQARRQARMRPSDALNALGTFVLHRTGRTLATGGLGLLVGSWLAPFVDATGGPAPLPGSDRGARLDEADRRAQQAILARRAVISSLRHQTSVLEARLPASRLDVP
ncbi:hypothetical protein [Actinophytocola sp.]|uniref:hypothetical protein n=1 Tax=Actinophytocola sp. TaxID=1872138 RepID=UPI002ED1733F